MIPEGSSATAVTVRWANCYDKCSRARAPKGERAYGKVPRNLKARTRPHRLLNPRGRDGRSVAIEDSTDSEVFEAYVEEFLAPTLEEGQVVVLDKLGAHRRTERVRELIEGSGSALPAFLLSGPQPDRGSVLQDKEHRQEGRGAHPQGAKRGHLRDTGGHHARRRGGLVRTLRLPTTGSTIMNTTIRARTQPAVSSSSSTSSIPGCGQTYANAL